MNISLREQLIDWKKNNKPISAEMRVANSKRPKKTKEQAEKKSERFSDRELANLMGTNMKLLKRGKGGAYK